MTGCRRPWARLSGCLATAALTTGAGLVVAVGAAAEGSGGLDGETLVLPIAGQYDACPAGASSYTFAVEGEAAGPRGGHYVGQVTHQVEGAAVVVVVEATIGTAQGELHLTQTGTADAGPDGACAPLVAGQVLDWTADLAGQEVDSGTTLLSGDLSALVAQLTSAPPVAASPTPSADPTPADPSPGLPPPDPSTTHSPGPATVDADIAFTYHVVARDGQTSGSCDVRGGTDVAPVHIVCADVGSYERHGRTVRFSGAATINGESTTYSIQIVDGAGTGEDSFLIRAGDGYVGGGGLTSGDLRVR